MSRPAVRYDIYLPLQYPDGREVEPRKYRAIEAELIHRFGGVTSVKQEFPLRGQWQFGGEVITDEIIVIMSINFEPRLDEDESYLQELKERLKGEFEQQDILITIQELRVV